jgi:hypothetical protein
MYVVINKLWDEAAPLVLFAVERALEWSKILFNKPKGIRSTDRLRRKITWEEEGNRSSY